MAGISCNIAQAHSQQSTEMQSFEGILDKDSKTTQEDGSFYTLYPINAKKGQKIIVNMQGAGFRPAFNIGHIDNGKLCLKCAVGHKNGENNATSIFYMRDNFPIKIRASAMRPAEGGSFKITATIIDPKPIVANAIFIGQQISESINANDAVDASLIDYDATLWGSIDRYYINLKAHQNIEIDASSDTEIPAIKFYQKGKLPYHLDWNADGKNDGNIRNIKANFKAPSDGRYYFDIANNNINNLAIAAPHLNGEINYKLSVHNDTKKIVISTPEMKDGMVIQDYFNKGKDLIGSRRGDLLAKDYIFKPISGKTYWIKAQSDETNISIWVGEKHTNGEFILLESGDDNAGGKGARVLYKSLNGKPVTIRLFSNYGYAEHQNKELAEYNISIKEMTRASTPNQAKPIKIGDKALINLKDGGARNELDALYDIYKVSLKQGEKITAFTSDVDNEVDTFLEIGTGAPSTFKAIAQDEDNGPGHNAKIKFIAPNDGEYLIRASATNSAHEDSFYLNLIPTTLPAPPPAPTEIATDIKINGELGVSSPVFGDDDIPYNDFIFNAEAGKKYKLLLKSVDFYANIMARPFDTTNDKFSQSIDNTPISPPIVRGTKDNSLEYIAPKDGKILVRVTSSVDNQIGKFTLLINKAN